MADLNVLVGDLQGGVATHAQQDWQAGDRVADPAGNRLALQSEIVAAAQGIQGSVVNRSALPDAATLDPGVIYIVREDEGGNPNGLWWVVDDPMYGKAWVFLDGLNLQDAGEVQLDASVAGLAATTVQDAVEELAAQASGVSATIAAHPDVAESRAHAESVGNPHSSEAVQIPYADNTDSGSGSAWSGTPPANIGEAMDRIAVALSAHLTVQI